MSREKTFKEYLSAIPKQTLTALFYGTDGKKIVSLSQVITDICRKFFETPYLSELLKTLPPDKAPVLRFLLLEGEKGADLPAIHAHHKQLSEEKINEELNRLQSLLLIFGVKTSPTRYYVFREIRERLQPLLIEEALHSLKKVAGVKEKKNMSDALFRDLSLFLLFLAREPLRRTKTGGLNKKQLDIIARSFENKIEFSASGETWPPLFALLHGFMIKKELLEELPEEWRLTEKGRRFLEAEASESAKCFYHHILREYKEEKARLLLTLLRRTGQPVNSEDLIRFFYSRSDADARPIPEVFEWLYYSGLIALVHGEHRETGFLLTERGGELLDKTPLTLESADKITIMPTFELIVPRHLQAGLLKVLFMICTLEKSDALLTFKITRESLFSGLDQGLKPDDCLKKITAMASHHIPQNVLFSIQEWMAAYGAVAFEMHFILRVKKPELYDKIKGVLANTRYIAEELPGTGFSIQAADYQEVFSILTRLGYSPKPFTGPRNNGDVKKAVNILDSYLNGRDAPAGADAEFVFPDEPEEKSRPSKTTGHGKYSGKLQSLPFNELVHVINYAILMETGLEVERKGNGGRMRIVPKEILLHLSEPLVKGGHPLNGDPLEVPINDIDKIRVED